MTAPEYIYELSDETVSDEWFEKLQSIDTGTEYGGDMYWLGFVGSPGRTTTLLEVSACSTKYRYVWRERGGDPTFDTGSGSHPSPRWLNPDARIFRGIQPLPFSWRA